jgi:hypothetical protein
MFKNEEEKLNLMIDRLVRLQEQFDWFDPGELA